MNVVKICPFFVRFALQLAIFEALGWRKLLMHQMTRGAWAIFPGAQPTEQPRRVPKVADRGMTFS